ncbi:MAG: hypothetical protein R2809_02655 [Flavobacteriales bacterium]
MEQGVWTSYYDSGRLKDKGSYDKGKLKGAWEGYYPNGVKTYVGS